MGFTPHNFTEPDWLPLERAVALIGLPLETCGEFMWMYEEPAGTHYYKHRETRRYVHLRSADVEYAAEHGDIRELLTVIGAARNREAVGLAGVCR